jgi:HSP20 family molecular chaperone IbpA
MSSSSSILIDTFLPMLNNVLNQVPSNTQHKSFNQIPVDLIELKNTIMLIAELPGVDKSNIKITTNGNNITLTVTKNARYPVDLELIKHNNECSYGSLCRTINIPKNCNMQPVDKQFENGVLILVFMIPPPENKEIQL